MLPSVDPLFCGSSTSDSGRTIRRPELQPWANTRHPNTCEPNPERFAQEERSWALRFSGNSLVGGREYGSRANQELQALVRILTLPAALSVRFLFRPEICAGSQYSSAFAAEQVRRL